MDPDKQRSFAAARFPDEPLTLVLVEDDDDHALLFSSIARRSLQPQPVVTRVASLDEAWKLLSNGRGCLTLLDLGLPESRGLATLDLVFERFPRLPLVVLTASSDEGLGEEAVRKGALDFLSKDEINERSFGRAIRYAIERENQRRALARSLEDLEEFAHVAAHDLKSPLYTISSMCSLIQSELLAGVISSSTIDSVGILSESAQKAARLVDGLLRFCKLGSASITRSEVDLNELVQEVVESLDERIIATGASVQCQALPIVPGDRELLEHVLQNLIANGLKFCGDKPPRVEVSANASDGGFEICVADHGIGIADQMVERIFDPFQRLNTEVEGSGLGLSICRRVMEAHGGRIWVDSVVGSGSSFRFFLPE